MLNITYSENKEIATFNGRKYYLRKSQGYYYSPRDDKKGCDMLHRMVYICNKGEIPKGYHIHHIDGDKSNNDISNLECISSYEHHKKHSENMSEEQLEKIRKNLQENVRPKADIWHGTEAGKEWHKFHYEMMKEKLHEKVKKCCVVCGKEYETKRKNTGLYCSPKCAAKARRNSGIDNEERICKNCGNVFVANKYSKKQFCNKKCAGQYKSGEIEEVECKNCGKKFISKKRLHSKFCCRNCANKYNSTMLNLT